MREIGLRGLHVNVAAGSAGRFFIDCTGLFVGTPPQHNFRFDNPISRGPETQNANPKVGVLFSSSEV
jgi:hypothetical protein